jgi:hypothetical protein
MGPEFKFKGGHDFLPVVGESEDEDPLPEIGPNGHGTHTSGIAAGGFEWYRGVAPNASLLGYKIFGKSVCSIPISHNKARLLLANWTYRFLTNRTCSS